MKRISVVVPTYNEEENVIPISEAIINEFKNNLPDYEYEILFIDNNSQDNTRIILRELCAGNFRIKAILNAKNFGQFNSPYYGMCQSTGDCTILMCADFQDPVEMIPLFVHEWEMGHRIVCGIKKTSRENRMMFVFRSLYYKIIKKLSETEQIEHFTGFGLYDKSFIQTLKNLDDPMPFLRGIVAELGSKRIDIPYEQARRRAGKTSNNLYRLYDAAMIGFTSYTKIGLRLATISGFILSGISILIAIIYLILKLMFWYNFPAGTTPILLGIFVFSSVQIFFIGLLGEYIVNMNTRIMHRPLVVEEERINFWKEGQ